MNKNVFLYALVFTLMINSANATYASFSVNSESETNKIKKEIKETQLNQSNIDTLINLYQNLFTIQKENKDYTNALKTAKTLEEIINQKEDASANEVFSAKLNILDIYFKTKDEKNKKAILDELEQTISTASQDNQAAYLISLAEFYSNYEDFEKVDQALNKLYKIPNISAETNLWVLARLCENYSFLKDEKKAVEYLDKFHKAILEYDSIAPFGRLADYYINKAYINNDVKQTYKNFLPIYEAAIANLENLKNTDKYNDNFSNLEYYLISTYIELGLFDNAKNAIDNLPTDSDQNIKNKYEKLIEYYENAPNFKERYTTISALKMNYIKNGNYDVGNKLSINEKYSNYYKDTQNYEKAKQLMLNALEIYDKYENGNPARKFVVYGQLADICKDNNQAEEALKYLALAKNTNAFSPQSFSYAQILIKEGNALNSLGKYDEAIKILNTAEKNLSIAPTNTDYASVFEALANAYKGKNDFETALKYFNKNLEIKALEYGSENVKYYKALIDKVNILKDAGNETEADLINNKIITDYSTNKIIGTNYDFEFDINLEIANKYIDKEEYTKAAAALDKAEKYAYTKDKHQTIKNERKKIPSQNK